MFIWAKIKLYLLAAAIGGTLAAGGAYKVHTWRVAALKTEWQSDTDKLVKARGEEVQKICDDNKQITKENAHALQTKLDDTMQRYYRLLRHTPSATGQATATRTAGGYNEAPRTDVPALCIPTADLAHYGKLNDDQAAALITLQDVVAAIYKANGQADLLPAEYR